MKSNSWFEVDKDGLAKLLEKRGKEFVIFELIQNAWDQNVSHVNVILEPISGRPAVRIVVEDDDPDGFSNLSHAFTLFAESEKKGDPQKRGRFNVGEKRVLALCEEATITSTTGSVIFGKNGRQTRRGKRQTGSQFTALIRMTRSEYEQVCSSVHSLIPPQRVVTVFNGQPLMTREPIHQFRASLVTDIADEEGRLRRKPQRAAVTLYEPLESEKASIYEMGIPVVETGDKWHVDINQKLPLNMDRDNVPPSYLSTIRTLVFNETHDRILSEDATTPWVREALSDPRCSDEAVITAVAKRFGERRVIQDLNDREANKIAHYKGYTVIPGGALSKKEWENVRRAKAALPAGQVTPSPRETFSPDGDLLSVLPVEEYTTGIRQVVAYSIDLARELLELELRVMVVVQPKNNYNAFYDKSNHMLAFNVGRLGYGWFDTGITDRVNSLLIHELGHEIKDDHLSPEYHRSLCDLGAKLARLALEKPSFFNKI